MKTNQIALDGPSGAGKSTIAKLLARELGYIYLDTGAMYRAAGLKAVGLGLDPYNEAQAESIIADTQISLISAEQGTRVFLDGEDVSAAIRTDAISMAASAISKHKAIRRWLQAMQAAIAEENDVIMDGRDIGTRVLPNAQFKFFLTASAEERANRRYKELLERGQEISYEEVLADIQKRDLQDSTRENDPLRQAEDAILIDSTHLTLTEVVDTLLKEIRKV